MIKVDTIGMFDVAKNNPTLTSATDTANYSFITVDGITYVIMNTITGDDAYIDDAVIKAGDYLNGFDVSAWNNQILVVDEKHIAYGSGEDYTDLTVADTTNNVDAALLAVDTTTGKLEIVAEAPASGVYFKVVDKVTLTGKAVKVKVIVVDKDTTAAAGNG